jgi:glyoxylase I family protein
MGNETVTPVEAEAGLGTSRGINGIHHVAVNVSDLATALEFWVGAMGFVEIPRPDVPVPGAWLQVGPNQVHLIVNDSFEVDRRQHVAFQVADLDATATDLEARGVTVKRMMPLAGAGLQALVQDPFGNRIELNQQL